MSWSLGRSGCRLVPRSVHRLGTQLPGRCPQVRLRPLPQPGACGPVEPVPPFACCPPHVHKSPTGTGGQLARCTRGGDGPARREGTRGGERTATVHGRRVVHVSTQDEGHHPTAGQQGHSRAELVEGARSPTSTAVMTKMKYFSRGVLEPHSGWGRPGPGGPGPSQAEQLQHPGAGPGRGRIHRGLARQGVGQERMGAAHRTGRAGALEHGVGTR